VYGGTVVLRCLPVLLSGLSPRVRGNLIPDLQGMTHVRSIPACTGEPVVCGVETDFYAVYPRVYGGTWTASERPHGS